MGRARPDLIRILEPNPPSARAGIILVRRVRTREYRTEIGPGGYLTQIEAAAFLGKSLMTVNRYVRLGLLRDVTREEISMIQLGELREFRREYLDGGKGGRLQRGAPFPGKSLMTTKKHLWFGLPKDAPRKRISMVQPAEPRRVAGAKKRKSRAREHR